MPIMLVKNIEMYPSNFLVSVHLLIEFIFKYAIDSLNSIQMWISLGIAILLSLVSLACEVFAFPTVFVTLDETCS